MSALWTVETAESVGRVGYAEGAMLGSRMALSCY